ncbi:MAG: ribulokinase [Treponema sp.]|nr:ribulokinase [Treponema sp.]
MSFLPGEHYVLGADFGSDSVRVVILDAGTGASMGQCVSYYERWKKGLYCDPKNNQFRQHPKDYTESLIRAIKGALEEATKKDGSCAQKVRGICIDTTGSTPALADENGTPLALKNEFDEDPDAMFVLWKDHTAVLEAEEINTLCRTWGGIDYTTYSGGVYSSEWFWAKILHTIRKNSKVKQSSYTAVEHCDWITAELCGNTAPSSIKRSRCAAGHKCLWHASWDGYPSSDFFNRLDPKLSAIAATLGKETWTTEKIQGTLTAEWSQYTGLPKGIPVCVGAYDAHIGAVGGDAQKGVLVKSIGTSTCDIIIGPKPKTGEKEVCVPGICGQVDGSVIDGWIGYEAGQSAYGDYFAWFRNLLMWPYKNLSNTQDDALEAFEKKILPALENEAAKIPVSEQSLIALDWINGRRTPYADQSLTAAIQGITLGTDAPSVLKALLESAAFGARAIIECFENGGIHIEKVVAIGGVARKSTLGMQILADVTNREIHVTASDQSPAIGAAIFASVAAGLYDSVFEAQSKLTAGIDRVHKPDPKTHTVYNTLYEKYTKLGAFVEQNK